jgi:hypothetical protein
MSEQRRLAEPEDYVATFQTFKHGEKVLEDLTARFHDRRIYQAGGLDAARETERRAAQKEVMEFIFRMIGMTPEANQNED